MAYSFPQCLGQVRAPIGFTEPFSVSQPEPATPSSLVLYILRTFPVERLA